MISFNTDDDQMEEIASATKLDGLQTKYIYRIYGLAQEANPPMLFSAQESMINSEQEKTIAAFLKTNGIHSETEDVPTNNRKIYIGIRRDVRNDIDLCSNLIQSLVYFLEGRLEIAPDFKIEGVGEYR